MAAAIRSYQEGLGLGLIQGLGFRLSGAIVFAQGVWFRETYMRVCIIMYMRVYACVCAHACMHAGRRQVGRQAGRQACVYASCMDEWMHGCMDAWMHACMDAWMDGWLAGWMDV